MFSKLKFSSFSLGKVGKPLEVEISNLSVAVGVCHFIPALIILVAWAIEVAAKQLDDVLVSGALLSSSHLILLFKLDDSKLGSTQQQKICWH